VIGAVPADMTHVQHRWLLRFEVIRRWVDRCFPFLPKGTDYTVILGASPEHVVSSSAGRHLIACKNAPWLVEGHSVTPARGSAARRAAGGAPNSRSNAR
jgi:hypothetical protein